MINIEVIPTRIGRTLVIREKLESQFHGTNVEAVQDRSIEIKLTNEQAAALGLDNDGLIRLDVEGAVWDRIGALVVDRQTGFWEGARCMWCEAAPGTHTPDCKRKVGISDGSTRRNRNE